MCPHSLVLDTNQVASVGGRNGAFNRKCLVLLPRRIIIIIDEDDTVFIHKSLTEREVREQRNLGALKRSVRDTEVGKIGNDVRRGCLQSAIVSNYQHQTVKQS